MSSDIRDGGAAFPNSVQPDFQYAEAGMSLRDWFAGQALVALGDSTNPRLPSDYRESWSASPPVRELVTRRARFAYLQADAMIAARDASHD